jgi:hypothetical protein
MVFQRIVIDSSACMAYMWLLDPLGHIFTGRRSPPVRIWTLHASLFKLHSVSDIRICELEALLGSEFYVNLDDSFVIKSVIIIIGDHEALAIEMGTLPSMQCGCHACILPRDLFTVSPCSSAPQNWESAIQNFKQLMVSFFLWFYIFD